MPLYEYVCEECQCRFEMLRGMSQADEPARCPRCEMPRGRRLLSRFTALSKGGDGSVSSVGGGSCASCGATSCAGCKH